MYATYNHRICAPCRYTTKYVPGPCPRCGQALVSMGKNFKAPRKDNDAQWRKLQLVVEVWQAEVHHHPNCWYAHNPNAGTVRWQYCRCPWLMNFHTPADVKSGLGLRRSRRKNWASPVVKVGHGRPRFDYGRSGV